MCVPCSILFIFIFDFIFNLVIGDWLIKVPNNRTWNIVWTFFLEVVKLYIKIDPCNQTQPCPNTQEQLKYETITRNAKPHHTRDRRMWSPRPLLRLPCYIIMSVTSYGVASVGPECCRTITVGTRNSCQACFDFGLEHPEEVTLAALLSTVSELCLRPGFLFVILLHSLRPKCTFICEILDQCTCEMWSNSILYIYFL